MIFDAAAFRIGLLRVFGENGLDGLLSDEKVDRLTFFALRLAEENEKYNLTALTTPEEMILRHFADCAALIPHLPERGKVMDVGCGAGFPSLVLAILCPSLSVTSLDATEKKVKFVRETADLIGLQNLATLTGRAEILAARGGELRKSFDVVTARAVARLPVLSELCLPFVSVGGTFLAMKGPAAEREAVEAARAIPQLGGRLEGVFSRTLRDDSETLTHAAVKIAKVKNTPPEYPRSYARILKKPL